MTSIVDTIELPSSFRHIITGTSRPMVFGVPAPLSRSTFSEDTVEVILFSYFLTKAALRGFAIVAIPFWLCAVGVLSLL